MATYWNLFLIFSKIGAFTLGGGYGGAAKYSGPTPPRRPRPATISEKYRGLYEEWQASGGSRSGVSWIDYRNSSVRQANFYVLKGVNSPAILIEMGYISSTKDRARLSQKVVQKRMAKAIYQGIYDYAKKEGWLK